MSTPSMSPRLHGRRPTFLRAVAVTLLLVAAPAASVVAADDRFAGHWEGEIEIPGQSLAIKVDLTFAEGAWSGAIDIPAQGAKGLALGGLAVTGDEITFAISGVPGEPVFKGVLADGGITGDFTQGPATLPFRLGREVSAPPPPPQEPKPPYPYQVEELTYRNGDVTLAGTLTLPEGAGPFPAAVLITGSGAQNRDEELLGHKPFLVLADHLTRNGVAVLRADDRGVGESTGKVAESTSSDFADDALAGIAKLREDARIDPKRIGVIGHSEGGLVGPLAASRSSDVAYVVMLAGPGVPGSEILPHQLGEIASASGVGEELVKRQVAIQRELVAAVVAGEPRERLEELTRQLVEVQSAGQLSGEQLEQTVDQALAPLTTTWFRFFLAHDPRPVLKQVKVPILALNGGLDLQVDPDQNLPEIERAVAENPDAVVRELEGLNHLFQHATSGAPTEYSQIEETFAPEALEAISGFILERFSNKAP